MSLGTALDDKSSNNSLPSKNETFNNSPRNDTSSYEQQCLLTPAERVKYIRTVYLKKSVSDLSHELYKNHAALRRIENHDVGLRKDMASYFCICWLMYYGLYVSVDWIMYGKGKGPYFLKEFSNINRLYANKLSVVPNFIKDCINLSTDKYSRKCINNMSLFIASVGCLCHQLQEDGIFVMVNDRHMSPIYDKGDIVFACYVNHSEREELNGEDCVIVYNNQVIKIKKVFYRSDDNTLQSTTNINACPEVIEYARPIYKILLRCKGIASISSG